MSRRISRLAAVVALSLVFGPLSAAAQLNLELSKLGPTDSPADGFNGFAGDFAQVIGPKMLGPADTTGALGFDVGLHIAVTNIDEEAAHWQSVADDVPSSLTAIQLAVNKGLPYSFELGGTVSHVVDTDVWGVGVHLKYALLEGYRLIPDLALRASVSTVLGSRDMQMLIVGGDLTVSKSFGIAGVLSLGPYAGYSLMYVRASSYVLGYFDGSSTPNRFVIPLQNIVRHRGFLGFRLLAVRAQLGFEVMLGDGVQTFTTKLGAEF